MPLTALHDRGGCVGENQHLGVARQLGGLQHDVRDCRTALFGILLLGAGRGTCVGVGGVMLLGGFLRVWRKRRGRDIAGVVVHRISCIIPFRILAARAILASGIAMVLQFDNQAAVVEARITREQLLQHLVWDCAMANVFEEEAHRRVVGERAFLAFDLEIRRV